MRAESYSFIWQPWVAMWSFPGIFPRIWAGGVGWEGLAGRQGSAAAQYTDDG